MLALILQSYVVRAPTPARRRVRRLQQQYDWRLQNQHTALNGATSIVTSPGKPTRSSFVRSSSMVRRIVRSAVHALSMPPPFSSATTTDHKSRLAVAASAIGSVSIEVFADERVAIPLSGFSFPTLSAAQRIRKLMHVHSKWAGAAERKRSQRNTRAARSCECICVVIVSHARRTVVITDIARGWIRRKTERFECDRRANRGKGGADVHWSVK